MEFFGWISSTMLLLCGVPQAYKSFKDGHSRGISTAFLVLWTGGEFFGLAYILTMKDLSLPLLTNYSFNAIMVSIMLFYKFFPRNFDADLPASTEFQGNSKSS